MHFRWQLCGMKCMQSIRSTLSRSMLWSSTSARSEVNRANSVFDALQALESDNHGEPHLAKRRIKFHSVQCSDEFTMLCVLIASDLVLFCERFWFGLHCAFHTDWMSSMYIHRCHRHSFSFQFTTRAKYNVRKSTGAEVTEYFSAAGNLYTPWLHALWSLLYKLFYTLYVACIVPDCLICVVDEWMLQHHMLRWVLLGEFLAKCQMHKQTYHAILAMFQLKTISADLRHQYFQSYSIR